MVSQEGSARGGSVVRAVALAAQRKTPARRGRVSSKRRGAGKQPGSSRHGGAAGGGQQQMQQGKSGFIQEENDDYKEHTVDNQYKSPPGSPQVELIID